MSAATPEQAPSASDWWVCTNPLPPHGTGQKITGPFATQELALNVRQYVEKAETRTDLWVDDEPAPDYRALLDQATSLLWDTGLTGSRQAAGELRASGGLEALT